MNEKSTESVELDGVYGALSAPPRRVMLDRLREGPKAAGELWDGLGITKPAVSKHLRVLEGAGVIERERDGRVHRFSLRAEPLAPAAAWILTYKRFWETRLDALAAFLEAGGDLDGR
ncbi:MAG: metalloregulator ArsR/SmtB family transcription factor [Planctomycetota bacterium]